MEIETKVRIRELDELLARSKKIGGVTIKDSPCRRKSLRIRERLQRNALERIPFTVSSCKMGRP